MSGLTIRGRREGDYEKIPFLRGGNNAYVKYLVVFDFTPHYTTLHYTYLDFVTNVLFNKCNVLTTLS
jgi:hypothetical protein